MDLQPVSPSAEDSAEKAVSEHRTERILKAAFEKCDKKEHPLMQLCADIVVGTYATDLKNVVFPATKCQHRPLGSVINDHRVLFQLLQIKLIVSVSAKIRLRTSGEARRR